MVMVATKTNGGVFARSPGEVHQRIVFESTFTEGIKWYYSYTKHTDFWGWTNNVAYVDVGAPDYDPTNIYLWPQASAPVPEGPYYDGPRDMLLCSDSTPRASSGGIMGGYRYIRYGSGGYDTVISPEYSGIITTFPFSAEIYPGGFKKEPYTSIAAGVTSTSPGLISFSSGLLIKFNTNKNVYVNGDGPISITGGIPHIYEDWHNERAFTETTGITSVVWYGPHTYIPKWRPAISPPFNVPVNNSYRLIQTDLQIVVYPA